MKYLTLLLLFSFICSGSRTPQDDITQYEYEVSRASELRILEQKAEYSLENPDEFSDVFLVRREIKIQKEKK